MNLWGRLVTDVDALVGDTAADGALFEFRTRVLAVSTGNRAVFERLAETGTRVHVGAALTRLAPAVDVLLDRARQAGAVRAHLISAGWSDEFGLRALTILFDGLRP